MDVGALPAPKRGVRTTSELDTTLVRGGNMAATFREIAEFANSIESRPLDKLIGDLPGLARMSEVKFNLARQVLRRRMRYLPDVEQEQLRLFADEVSADTDENAQSRIRSVFVQRDTA